MIKQFTKGQAVHLIHSWDDLGTFSVTPAIVHSCGSKQMVLTHAVSGQELGRHFRPVEIQSNHFHRVVAHHTQAQAEALALELAKNYQVHEIAVKNRSIENSNARYGVSESANYARAMRIVIAQIEATQAAVIFR